MYNLSSSKLFARFSSIALSIMALALAGPLRAQSQTMRVNVPFSFESGDTHMAAGEYLIHLNYGSPIMRIEGSKQSAFQTTIPDSSASPASASKVVFHRYGTRYVLKEVWVAGSTSHLHTPRSRTEKDLELAQAKTNTQENLALLAAKQ